MTDAELARVPVVLGPANRTIPRAEYREPPDVPPRRINEMLLGSDIEQDHAAAYLRGDFHETVVVHGAKCDGECGQELTGILTRTAWGGKPGTHFQRERSFPFRATHKQVRQGGTCGRCKGRIVISYTRGPEGGPLETSEV